MWLCCLATKRATDKTSENISCHNTITQQNMVRTVPNKLEKGTNLFFFACPPELVITCPCAHLHPKSKLIHFAKSSAAPCLAC